MILKRIPTEQDLTRLYWELSRLGAPSVGKKNEWLYKPRSREELIVLACDMLRYDPRLLTILIIYFKNHWKDLNPIKLRAFLPKMKHPQVFGVIKEFLSEDVSDRELGFFFEYIVKGLKPVEPQLFFVGVFQIGSKKHPLTAQKSLRQYSKWGFLSMERPIVDLRTKKTVGAYSFQTRQKIILDLIMTGQEISLKEYLKAVNHTISRQQALYDLKHCGNIKLKGHGRGAKWIKR